ncbi:unnamed protein product [Urochloa decumbens]|uniref:F-box/LRR-repeat protein 15/At3g58940/PEG3-like LRR domain-containing protein n=1 Tax=Urochloa decumbens TaxID=240449 RepID=A0ABC9FNX4_9POAL
MAQGGGGGGEIAAKHGKLSSSSAGAGDEDRLSALPDDVLVLILLGLGSTAGAARTSVLSRRWRHLWAFLPDLRFYHAPDGHRIRKVLLVPDPPPPLRWISVTAEDSSPDSLGAWLLEAARRLSGYLICDNIVPRMDEEAEEEGQAGERGAVQLPCFENAAGIYLKLGFLGLALPFSGTFARLIQLRLHCVRFHGPCELGGVVSSQRCPCLQKLSVRDSCGVDKLTIHSKSLLRLNLWCLKGLRQLTVVAPALNGLKLFGCFTENQPIADISTPQLVSLEWMDSYDPGSVQLGDLGQLQRLTTDFFLVYWEHGSRENHGILKLLQQFRFIHILNITLAYLQDIDIFPYSMEDITMLPHTTFLIMDIMNNGHGFGPSSFHMLRLCTDIRRLSLNTLRGLESSCQSGCNCEQPTNWKTEKLLLNRLEEVKITGLKGADHEVVFLERLFSWATVLKKMKITFDDSVSKRQARELLQTLASFSKPETVMEFYMYHDGDKKSKYLLTPEDKEL